MNTQADKTPMVNKPQVTPTIPTEEIKPSVNIEQIRLNSMEINKSISTISKPKNNKLLFFWIASILSLLFIAIIYPQGAKKLYGISGSKEKTFSFQHPVEIISIAVVEGAEVVKGEVLAEVRRYDLTASRAIIEERINELRSDIQEISTTTAAKITSLKANNLTEQSELDIQIDKVKSQLTLNKQWQKDNSAPSTNILINKLNALKKQKQHISTSYQATINNLQQQLRNHARPADSQLTALFKQQQELQRQASTLKITASFSGRIGSVLYSSGEQVPKFSPLITLYEDDPSYIKAYIHEEILHEISIGQAVRIESLTTHDSDFPLLGTIKSMGNRIVEYPPRLKRNPMVSAWGREIIIDLKPQNNLLLGERVSVLLSPPGYWQNIYQNISVSSIINLLKNSLFDSLISSANSQHSTPIKAINEDLINPKQEKYIEGSGIVWDPTQQQYWLIDDESNHLFTMSISGNITSKLVIDKFNIDDAESISLEADSLFVAASISNSKSSKNRKKRNQLVRFKRDQKGWKYFQSLDLAQKLKQISLSDSIDSETRNYLLTAINSGKMDIESHQVINNHLYLGFKSPLTKDQQAVIIKITDLASLFSSGPASLSINNHTEIWKKIKLTDPNKQTMKLSDMFINDTHIYMTGVSTDQKDQTSSVFSFDIEHNSLLRIQSFKNDTAEGITINSTSNVATVVFDNGGKKPSSFTHMALK